MLPSRAGRRSCGALPGQARRDRVVAGAAAHRPHRPAPQPGRRGRGQGARPAPARPRGRPGPVEPADPGHDHGPPGRVRRPGRAHRRPAGGRLRRLRGPDHPADPRLAARLGPVPGRLPGRRDGRGRRRPGPAAAGRAGRRRRPYPAVLPRPPAPHPDRLLPGPAARRGQAPVPGHGLPVGPGHRARVAGDPLWNEQEGSGAHAAEAGTTGWRGVPGTARPRSAQR